MQLSFWRLQLIGWGAYWLAMSGSRFGRIPLFYMMASKAVLAALGLALSGLILRPLYRRFLRDDPSVFRTLLIAGVGSYVVAALWTALHGMLDMPIADVFFSNNRRVPSFWYFFGGTLYNAFTMLAWSVLYVGIKHQRAMHTERERALRAETLAQSAQLSALRYQLNPHFLFNSLNAISTLVMEQRTQEATTMISRLADLLRSTLDMPSQEVSLETEIALVTRYLDIEKVRLGERLRVHIVAQKETLGVSVPSLILQPLVENAVKHAVAPRESGGHVTITANRDNGNLRLTVEDDGPGLTGEQNGGGIGIANTRERLKQIYGDTHRLSFERSSLGGLRVRIELPFRNE